MTFNLLESRLFGRVCYGYFRREDSIVEIDEEKAEIVRSIFHMYLAGESLETIQSHLYQKGTPSPSGKPKWTRDVIDKVLNNGKYMRCIVTPEEYLEVLFLKKENCRFNRDL